MIKAEYAYKKSPGKAVKDGLRIDI